MKQIDTIRAALEMARDYITSDLASERGAFEGHESVSRIDEIKADLANNAAALAALAELDRAAKEPVAWQYRLDGDCEWSQCSKRGFDTLVSIGECETRQLYTTPPHAQPAPGMFTADQMRAVKFEANELWDALTSALQWLRNIKDGISAPETAIENTEAMIIHCREVGDRTP